ncbi:hypothetical protein [Fluviicola taffensis]|uniref:DUF4352 domain-containing protein n=1 Tax=Fluviicola taffensis (strain DSM 16823 / NCIMB 13979 / RW262) TaxID=755732 RepID=F2IA97_FLUTR|nr:hypothetical protein [Fluviicola taffensis]AEA42032.1 hypothetical protein Fluta_0022 [Fluviicola taffensis DSM 16823]
MKSQILIKLTLSILGIFLITGNLFSQEKLPVEKITTEWTLFQEVKGVKFYIKKDIHQAEGGSNNVDYALVKLENTTNKEISVSYSLAVHYAEGCKGCNSSENNKKIAIPSNSSVTGNTADGFSPVATLLINHNQKDSYIPLFISTENLIIK